MNGQTDLQAWAYLSRVAEAPCADLATLLQHEGPAGAAERIRRGEVGPALAQRTEARRDVDCTAADLETLARRGGEVFRIEIFENLRNLSA